MWTSISVRNNFFSFEIGEFKYGLISNILQQHIFQTIMADLETSLD